MKAASIEALRVGGVLQQESSARQDPQALRAAAQKFESVLVQQLFKEMRRTSEVFGDRSLGSEFYEGMLDEVAAQLSSEQGGIGLAEMILRSWGVEESGDLTAAEAGSEGLDALAQAGDKARWCPPIEGVQARPLETLPEEGFMAAIEFDAPEGSPFHPVAPGRVTRVADLGQSQALEIHHPGGVVSRYYNAQEAEVKEGQWVSSYQVLACAEGENPLTLELSRANTEFGDAHRYRVG